jgi:hypothetical protein
MYTVRITSISLDILGLVCERQLGNISTSNPLDINFALQEFSVNVVQIMDVA